MGDKLHCKPPCHSSYERDCSGSHLQNGLIILHGYIGAGKSTLSEHLQNFLNKVMGWDSVIINNASLENLPLSRYFANPEFFDPKNRDYAYVRQMLFYKKYSLALSHIQHGKIPIFDSTNMRSAQRIQLFGLGSKYSVPCRTALISCQCSDEKENLERIIRKNPNMAADVADAIKNLFRGFSSAHHLGQSKQDYSEHQLFDLFDKRVMLQQDYESIEPELDSAPNIKNLIETIRGKRLNEMGELRKNAKHALTYLKSTSEPIDSKSTDRAIPTIRYNTISETVEITNAPYYNTQLLSTLEKFLLQYSHTGPTSTS